MGNHDHIELTSSEISVLWATYQSDTMTVCGLNYFLNHVDDQQIHAILQETLALMEQHVRQLTQLFQKKHYPLPQGFSERGPTSAKKPPIPGPIINPVEIAADI